MSDTNDSLNQGHSADSACDEGKVSSANVEQMTFSFATFNVLHGRVPRGPFDVDAFQAAVASLRADVIGLQEVDRRMLRSRFTDSPKLAAAACGQEVVFVSARRRYDFGLFGNALLTSKPLTDVSRQRLFQRSWHRERRAAVSGTVAFGGVPWRVATTHLSLHRDESEHQLRRLLNKLAEHDGPAVLAGDFNRRPNEVIPMANAMGWEAIEADNTYPAWDPTMRLDYVLTRNCRAISAEVRQMPISDHRALLTEIVML